MAVVTTHISTMALKILPINTVNWYIGLFLDTASRPAVHIFILLGGYFLGTREITPKDGIKRAIKMAPPIIVLAIIIAATQVRPFTLINIKDFIATFILGSLSFKGTIWYGHLWFLYPYTILILLSPLLNVSIANLSKDNFKGILLIMITLFFIFPSINLTLGEKLVYATGQPYPYFVTSYLTGAYIRKFGIDISKRSLLVIFITSVLWGWFMSIVQADFMTLHHKLPIGKLGSYENMFMNEQIGVFIGAISVLLIFLKMEFKGCRFISSLSRLGFYGYTIHFTFLFLITYSIGYKSDYVFSHLFLPITIVLVVVITILSLLYGYLVSNILQLNRHLK